MEILILTCLQAQLIATKVISTPLSQQTRNDLILEIKQVSPKECKLDTNIVKKD